MSTWFSWATAAPGVMVEVIDAVEERRAPWRAAGGRVSGWRDSVGVPARPASSGRPSRRRTDDAVRAAKAA